MKEIDPNRVHIGKRVIVVGGIGGSAEARHYKSYKGTIKNMNPAGAVWVELNALNQKVVQFTLSDLALLLVFLIQSLCIARFLNPPQWKRRPYHANYEVS